MMRFLRIATAWLALSGAAFAQSGQIPSATVWGNPGASKAVAVPASVSAILDRALGSTRGAIIERGASGWAIIGPGTVALPFVSAGAGADPLYQILGLAGGGTGATSASGARTNLGLGTAALANTGTSGATLGFLNTANTWSASQAFNSGLTFALGSDATGDIYYRTSGGLLARLPIGGGGNVLGVVGGLPSWTSAGAGTVSSITCGSTFTCSPNPITATGTIGLNLGNANTWTTTQTFAGIVVNSINGLTSNTPTGTLAVANGKTLTASNSITIAGVDGKTLTLNNTIAFAGTDGTTMTFPASNANIAALNLQNQTLTGGAIVVPNSLAAGTTFSVNCGLSPLQWILNNAAFTINPPASANSQNCAIRVINGSNASNAGTVTLASGWSGKTPGGVAFATTPTISAAALTFTNGSANITWPATTPGLNSIVFLATTGTLPTGFAVNTLYYVVSQSGTTVTLSSTPGGTAITAGSAGSGTQTGYEPSIYDLVVLNINSPPYAQWNQVQ